MEYVFISGATGGIGKAFAFTLADLGNNLFITGRSQEKLSYLKEDLVSKYKVKVMYYPCDLTDEQSREDMMTYIDNSGIRITKLFNVAGVDIQKGFLSYTCEKLLFQLKVNVEATISLTHALLKRNAENMEILTISSMSGAVPMPYFAVYSATKSMLVNFFTALHYELKEKGVKVTTVMPGGVYTRPDIIQDIKGQKLWGKLTAKTPLYIARKSIKALNKNKVKYIPGFFNKFLYYFMKIIPLSIKENFIKNRWKKQTKDAF